MTTAYTHPDYRKNETKWRRVRDAVAGEDAVKAAARAYLPAPDEERQGWDDLRYASYLRRAVYYNVTGRTLAGLVGVAFANWPQVETTDKYLLDDADGSGVGLIGQAQWMLAGVMQTGRGGILADLTRLDPTVSRRIRTVGDADAAGQRGTVTGYAAEDILTWELEGSTLTRVVLRERYANYANGEVEYWPQLRELKLDGGRCKVAIWRQYRDKGDFVRTDGWDMTFSAIPFTFVGAVNNDPHPDPAPLLDLANLNLAHYRNSADYEESAFLMGQPTLWMSGTEDERSIVFGSRAAISLPPGGQCGLLQVSPNSLAKEAMDAKEQQMQALGARLLAQGSAVKTATQSAAETKAAYSALSLACDNVSLAYTRALQHIAMLRRGGAGKASFAIDTRFNDLMLDANAIREVVAAWQAGLVPQSDAWTVLRRLGVIDQAKTDTQLAGEIEGQGAPLLLDDAGIDVDTAVSQLDAAIALHEKHMNGTAPTTGPAGEKSQQLMMDQMTSARAALGGGAPMAGM